MLMGYLLAEINEGRYAESYPRILSLGAHPKICEEHMSYYTVTIEDTGESYRNSEKQTVLDGMAMLGKKGIPVGCCGGGCGVCKIEVISGSYTKKVMSREHVSVEDETSNRVLACRIWPTSDLRLRVLGKMNKNVCRTNATASEGSC